MAYWLVKTEPGVYSIADLARDKRTLWDCVRNYQARNYLKQMQIGDDVLIYHSNSEPSGIVGLAQVVKLAEADPTQFDRRSDYYDSAASEKEPRWFSPTLEFVRIFPKLLTLPEIRKNLKLKDMVLLQRGSRLSVHPVSDKEFSIILKVVSA
ncbi:MAG: EVE domain-containing protein [Oligoflexia bacterium]|nr:EVE domain-containing protein [Oligoflexia bacterium]